MGKKIPVRLSADFSAENLQGMGLYIQRAQRKQNKTKQKNCHQPRIFYPEKLSLGNKGEVKTFPDKQKLRELKANRPAYKKC